MQSNVCLFNTINYFWLFETVSESVLATRGPTGVNYEPFFIYFQSMHVVQCSTQDNLTYFDITRLCQRLLLVETLPSLDPKKIY